MSKIILLLSNLATLCGMIVSFTACQQEESQPSACSPPTEVVAQTTCESGFQGTLLISSGYKEIPQGSILFEVFPQKDTLSSDLNVKAWQNGSNMHERILVSDDVIGNAPKFIVQVSVNCSGKYRDSKYFAFVKRPAANPACFVWRQQAL